MKLKFCFNATDAINMGTFPRFYPHIKCYVTARIKRNAHCCFIYTVVVAVLRKRSFKPTVEFCIITVLQIDGEWGMIRLKFNMM